MYEMASSIFSTRRGFLYQDRFAILTFLDHIQQKTIKSFFTDFPLLGQKSLDIRIITLDGREKMFEVKTGENFAKDKRKNASSEIKEAFANIREYAQNKNNLQCNLVLSHNLTGKIDEYIYHLKNIQNYSSFQAESVKTSASWIKDKLCLADINSSRELFDFLKTVNIIISHSDILNNDNDQYPDIDDLIMCKISDLAGLCQATECLYELPSEILLYKLLHQCRSQAGTSNDLMNPLIRIIIDFFSQRKVLTNYTRNSGDFDSLKDQSKSEITNLFASWLPINERVEITTINTTGIETV